MINPMKQLNEVRSLIDENSQLYKFMDSIHARLEKMNEQMDELILEIKENNAVMRDMLKNRCSKTINVIPTDDTVSD